MRSSELLEMENRGCSMPEFFANIQGKIAPLFSLLHQKPYKWGEQPNPPTLTVSNLSAAFVYQSTMLIGGHEEDTKQGFKSEIGENPCLLSASQ